MVGTSATGTVTIPDYKLTPEKVANMFKELDPAVTISASATSKDASSKEMDKLNEIIEGKLKMRFWVMVGLGVLLAVAAITILIMFFRKSGSNDGR